MKPFPSLLLMLAFTFSLPAFATVNVSSPGNGTTVPSSVHFAATGFTGCQGGVAAMGIYVDNSLTYQVNGASLDTTVTIGPGSHSVAVQEWDFCGAASNVPMHLNVSDQAGVAVASPANNSTVSSVVHYAASASSSCPSGVAAMGIYVNDKLAYVQQGAAINTQLTLPGGVQKTTVQDWDNCGTSSKSDVVVNVQGGNPGGNKLANLQTVGGWNQWGELSPSYGICDAPCDGKVNWSMYQHYRNGSLSGNATQFNMGGRTPYSDVLWSIKLIGQASVMGLPDNNRAILPNVHHMTYDTDVYVGNLGVAQSLEFDANIFMDGVGMEWGTQCNHLNGNVWDIWNNADAHWVHTSAPCTFNDQSWNHLSFTVQRESNNDLTYQTITVNGVTYNIDQTVAPFHVPHNWYGMTANYQMDGDRSQSAYTTMLDNFSVTYW